MQLKSAKMTDRKKAPEASIASRWEPTANSFPCLVHKCLTDIDELAKRGGESQEFQKIFSWQSDGLSFKVHNSTMFAQKIMPVWFPRIKQSSFLRQLTRFGFKKCPGDGDNRGAMYHALFVRGIPELAQQIKKVDSKKQPQQLLRIHAQVGILPMLSDTAMHSPRQSPLASDCVDTASIQRDVGMPLYKMGNDDRAHGQAFGSDRQYGIPAMPHAPLSPGVDRVTGEHIDRMTASLPSSGQHGLYHQSENLVPPLNNASPANVTHADQHILNQLLWVVSAKTDSIGSHSMVAFFPTSTPPSILDRQLDPNNIFPSFPQDQDHDHQLHHHQYDLQQEQPKEQEQHEHRHQQQYQQHIQQQYQHQQQEQIQQQHELQHQQNQNQQEHLTNRVCGLSNQIFFQHEDQLIGNPFVPGNMTDYAPVEDIDSLFEDE